MDAKKYLFFCSLINVRIHLLMFSHILFRFFSLNILFHFFLSIFSIIMSADLVFSVTDRGNTSITYKGYMYTKTTTNQKGITTFRCLHSRRNLCKAQMKIKLGDNEIVVEPRVHSHDSLPLKAKFRNTYQGMKRDGRIHQTST